MTPENSERPRETRDGVPLVERFDAAAEAERKRAVEVHDRTRNTHERLAAAAGVLPLPVNLSGVVLAQGHSKVSSPELASLAAKYVDVSASDWPEQSKDVAKFLQDVRSLAASVLAQAEGNPRK